MMAIVHARGATNVYEKHRGGSTGKYVIIDKLEDRVDELSDIETSKHSNSPIRKGNSTL